MTYKTLQTNFERELLFQIIYNMKQNKLSHERAKTTAQQFLPVLKSANAVEFIERLSHLARTSPEVMEAFIKTVKEYEKEKTELELDNVRKVLLTVNDIRPPAERASGPEGGEYHGN